MINIFGEQPCSAWLLTKGVEVEIPFEQLKVGDIVVVNAGEVIPIDGVIETGIVSIDQQRLTGESQPAEKIKGNAVFATTVVLSGKLHICVEQTGMETSAAQISKVLNETSNFQLSIQTRAEYITDKVTLPTLLLSTIALPITGIMGSLALMGNYPGANLRLLSPMTLLNFLQTTYQKGILVKDGRSLELMNNVDTVVFDKTGTLTLDKPEVKQIYCCHLYTEDEIISYAATAEYRQSHPVAHAILQAAEIRGVALQPVDQANYEVGYGIKVNVAEKQVWVGSSRFMEMENIVIPEAMLCIEQQAQEQGYSLIMVTIDNILVGMIELEASLRPETTHVIQQLQQQGLDLCIISGDQEGSTRSLAEKLAIKNYFANTLPEGKASLIKQLQDNGKCVCFVGDGINDSIALAQADVSISLSGASSVATDSAQIVLLDANLERLLDLRHITQSMNNNMRRNITISAIPGVVGVGAVFFFHIGITTSSFLYAAGLLSGIANTMRPVRTRSTQLISKVK